MTDIVCTVLGERVVMVGGLDCMCGGTHVKNTQDIRQATATKIKKVCEWGEGEGGKIKRSITDYQTAASNIRWLGTCGSSVFVVVIVWVHGMWVVCCDALCMRSQLHA